VLTRLLGDARTCCSASLADRLAALPPGLRFAANAFDILFDGFDFRGTFQHDVGTGFAGMYGVFANGRWGLGRMLPGRFEVPSNV
jgi:hypothetical protein